MIRDQSCLITVGSVSVKLRLPQDQVTSSFRPIVYLRAGGERFHPYCLTLFALRELCFSLFNIPFQIDWGTSDDADTFISSHVFFNKNPTVCDITEFDEVPRHRTVAIDEDSSVDSPVAGGLFLTQADDASKEDDVQEDDASDDGCVAGESVLNCYFHVTHAFAQKKSYVKKMRSPEFAKSVAFRHVSNIAKTKTPEQRRTVTQLYLNDWRNNRGEKAAADHLQKEYCVHPKWNWNYCCTGEVGVYPSNCPNEAFNKHGIKGIGADCPKNASLCSFLVHTAPNLLKADAFERSDPCTIEIPKTCSVLAVGLTGFVREGIDVVGIGSNESGGPSSWLSNLRHRIGIPLDEQRINLIRAAYDGDERPFLAIMKQRGNKNPREDAIADEMMSVTKSICHLSWHSGNIVGDCEDCVKHLGYSCPGAVWLRSSHGLLHASVNTLTKTSANASGSVAKSDSRGNWRLLYESGLSTRNKRRCLPKMLHGFEDYLSTLNRGQLCRLIWYLRLAPRDVTVDDFIKGKTQQDLFDLLIQFYDNQSKFRGMLRNTNGTTTPYEVVKTLATKMQTAEATATYNQKENVHNA
ncbi:hypothetical protein SEMRO_1074_G238280.1 [Seminavis robusta]|uniref:Uncharacterized protein n=1 Tax=Seminavis robusta TaxID=568900 RepID=A0A9N8HPC7_9STRA|nr:hypothetical protein SEMRO_1074_G238280.1 [Seminavis robusta]|eukprot:Sro1074_g238280.1 n/a (579) ;mRNA; r:11407-13143